MKKSYLGIAAALLALGVISGCSKTEEPTDAAASPAAGAEAGGAKTGAPTLGDTPGATSQMAK